MIVYIVARVVRGLLRVLEGTERENSFNKGRCNMWIRTFFHAGWFWCISNVSTIGTVFNVVVKIIIGIISSGNY